MFKNKLTNQINDTKIVKVSEFKILIILKKYELSMNYHNFYANKKKNYSIFLQALS